MNDHRFIEKCPVCGGRDLRASVTFDAIPVLCNALYNNVEQARAAPTGRFELTFCRTCTHVFNAAFDEARIGYTQSYENSLHFSPRFVEFADGLAKRLNDTYCLSGKSIVDIGCGKGDFLKRLCAISGARGVGFDKSFEEARGKLASEVHFVNDWFTAKYSDVDPRLICCRHVLEHIAAPLTFLRELRSHPSVGAETVIYFEVPNALYTLRDLGVWDLIYEHVSYFTPASLRMVFALAGFDVLDDGTSFGGQYLYIEARPGEERKSEHSESAGEIGRLIEGFGLAYNKKVDDWRGYLASRDPGRLAVWGAGSKGITFVNIVPGGDRIGALVDVNPHKQGRFAPGTGTPVIAPDGLRRPQAQSIIIMNPLYREEIAASVAALGLESQIVVAQ